jgi:hypothetical protein
MKLDKHITVTVRSTVPGIWFRLMFDFLALGKNSKQLQGLGHATSLPYCLVSSPVKWRLKFTE